MDFTWQTLPNKFSFHFSEKEEMNRFFSTWKIKSRFGHNIAVLVSHLFQMSPERSRIYQFMYKIRNNTTSFCLTKLGIKKESGANTNETYFLKNSK